RRKQPGSGKPPRPRLLFSVELFPSFQRRLGVEIRFLRFDIPVAQVLESDLAARDRAHDEAAGLDDLEVRIEKLELGLAWRGAGCKGVHGAYMPRRCGEVKT